MQRSLPRTATEWSMAGSVRTKLPSTCGVSRFSIVEKDRHAAGAALSACTVTLR